MNRLVFVFALGLIGCPSPVESTSATPSNAAGIAEGEGNSTPSGPPGPPPPVPEDVAKLQKELGALNKKGLALKQAAARYIEQNTAGGMLAVDNGSGGTDTLEFVRFHDPVRNKPNQGYLVLSDFKAAGAAAEAFHTVTKHIPVRLFLVLLGKVFHSFESIFVDSF